MKVKTKTAENTSRRSKSLTKPDMARPRHKLMLRTTTFSPPKPHVFISLRNTQDITKFVSTANLKQHQKLTGNGTTVTTSGTDGMVTLGITGAHPRMVSPPKDGPGIRDSGITTAGSSNTSNTNGSDGRTCTGSTTLTESILTHHHQSAKRFADHS